MIGASRNFTFSIPDLEALARARESMDSERSTPIARPVVPTLRAAWKTSKPAPEPRSRTVSLWRMEDQHMVPEIYGLRFPQKLKGEDKRGVHVIMRCIALFRSGSRSTEQERAGREM